MIFPVSPPTFLKKVFGGLVWNIPTKEKKIYLTFDDGPIPEVTPFVLELLKKYNAKATFFCIGDNITKYPDIFNTILANNHSIGNHTQEHLNAWKVSHEKYVLNIEKAENTIHQNQIASITKNKKLFRPPYGKITLRSIRSLKKKGYAIVMWDVLSFDWLQDRSPEVCLHHILKHAKSGSIIVLHDSLKAYKNMSYILPRLLEHYSSKGFTFESLQIQDH